MLEPVAHVFQDVHFDESARTEDVKFSPSGEILAVVSTFERLYLFAVEVNARPIRILRFAAIRSSSLASPHGVDFLEEGIVVVANRKGRVAFFSIPGMDRWDSYLELQPLHEMDAPWFGRAGATRRLGNRLIACGPGSVRINGSRLIVACNNRNTVSEHPYSIDGETLRIGEANIVAQQGLEVPDGVAVSRDGCWMAVSDHVHHRVVVYRCPDYAPVCFLEDEDLLYPHGLCFDRTGRWLYVADAGGRDLHVFDTKDICDLQNISASKFKLPAVGGDAFLKTRSATAAEHRALEGGLKGIDIDPSNRVLATTCRHQTLRFFERFDSDNEPA